MKPEIQDKVNKKKKENKISREYEILLFGENTRKKKEK